jgi:NTE family protein
MAFAAGILAGGRFSEIILSALSFSAPRAEENTCKTEFDEYVRLMNSSPKIGLALGGGGARGLAHIPLLEAFDELGIKPAVIAGCSMGALVGAAYAGGMSGRELREHGTRLLSKKIDMARHVFGYKHAKLGDIFSLKGLLSLHLDGQKLADIVLPDQLPQLIEDQKIPFKVIATDYERMEEVVFSSGSLLQAVGASIAIPGLISAPKINGRIHVDGGVKNPVPFDHVTEGMDFVVAIDVTGRPQPSQRVHPSNIEIAVGSLLIMFNELANLRRAQSPPDIYIIPEVDRFGAGDFFKVKEILAAAEPAKERLKRALELRLNAAS